MTVVLQARLAALICALNQWELSHQLFDIGSHEIRYSIALFPSKSMSTHLIQLAHLYLTGCNPLPIISMQCLRHMQPGHHNFGRRSAPVRQDCASRLYALARLRLGAAALKLSSSSAAI